MNLRPKEEIIKKIDNVTLINTPRTKEDERRIETLLRKTGRKGDIILTNERIIYNLELIFKEQVFDISFKDIKHLHVARNIHNLKEKLILNYGQTLGMRFASYLINPTAGLLFEIIKKVKDADKFSTTQLREAEIFLGGYGYLFITHRGQYEVDTLVAGPIPRVTEWYNYLQKHLIPGSAQDICSECGEPLKGKKKFCIECGTKVGSE